MFANVELRTVEQAVSQYYLPWTKLFGDRKHLATCHPGWWQACFDALNQSSLNHTPLPYMAMVRNSGQIIGFLPVQRLHSGGLYKSTRWQLNLSPFCAGGVIGEQATATLNSVIRQLQNQSQQSHGWQLCIDASDAYLNNRLQTAFSLARLTPSLGRPLPMGWSIQRKTNDTCQSPAFASEQELPDHFDSTWKLHVLVTGLGHQDQSWKLTDAQPLIDHSLQHDGFQWIATGESSQRTWIGFWDLETSRNLGGQRVLYNSGAWMPWCIVSQSANPLASQKFWPSVFDQVAPLGVKQLFIPNEFSNQSSTDLYPKSIGNARKALPLARQFEHAPLGIDAKDASYTVSRWLLQERTFQRPSIWSKLWYSKDRQRNAT